MTVVSRGEREAIERFEVFPQFARAKLESRIRDLTETLQARVQAAAPQRTGKLRSEISGRVYADNPDHISGYVGVYARDAKEYPKAATLEYGSTSARKRMTASRSRLVQRISKPVHITAIRFLRGPFEGMKAEIEAAIAAALLEAAEDV